MPLHDLSMSASIHKSIHSTLFLPVALYFSVVLFFSVWHFDFHSFIDPPPISILLHTEQTHTHTHSGAILSTSNGSHIFHIRSQWWCTTPASPLCIKCKESATSISSWNNISHSHLIWSRTYAGDESAFTLLIGFCVNSNVCRMCCFWPITSQFLRIRACICLYMLYLALRLVAPAMPGALDGSHVGLGCHF